MIAVPASADTRRASPGLHGAAGWSLCAAAPSMLAAVLDDGMAQAFAFAGAIATVMVMSMYARAVSWRIRSLTSALAAASHGDLTHPQAGGPPDAIGDAMRSADAFAAMVSQIVAQVKSEAVVIAFEGRQFLQRSQDLSARTGQQAAALHETAASVHELSASASRHVDSVQRVCDMVGAVKHAALAESVEALSLEAQAVMAAAKSQSRTLAQISEAMRHIDSAVQQNALMVDMIGRSAGLLTEKSQRFGKSIANARLRQATADEARAMLFRAMQHIEAVGQRQAFDDFHRSDAGFIDRDLYIVVTDRDGNCKVFGSRPEFVGKNIASVPGIDAEQLLRDAIQLGPDLLIGCGAFKSA